MGLRKQGILLFKREAEQLLESGTDQPPRSLVSSGLSEINSTSAKPS